MTVVKRRPPREFTPEEKLKHEATKQITRELKKVKVFLVQKLVKRCRKLREAAAIKKGKPPGSRKASHAEPEEEEQAERRSDDGADSSSADESASETPATLADGPACEQVADAGPVQHEDTPAVKACLEEIRATKALTAEIVVRVCLRRLGLAYTGLEHMDLSDAADKPGAFKTALIHPKMQAVMKALDERASDLRKGVTEKRKRKRPVDEESQDNDTRRPFKQSYDGRRYGSSGAYTTRSPPNAALRPSQYDKAVFVDSLAGYVPANQRVRGGYGGDGDDDDMDICGPGSVQKNRPGQRARRARFDAMQAATGSHSTDHRGRRGRSFRDQDGGGRGWRDRGADGGGRYGPGHGAFRESSTQKKGHWDGYVGCVGGGGGNGGGGGVRGRALPAKRGQSDQVESAVPAKAGAGGGGGAGGGDEKLHPSWVAKQALKAKESAGITPFQGKKITFRDDDE